MMMWNDDWRKGRLVGPANKGRSERGWRRVNMREIDCRCFFVLAGCGIIHIAELLFHAVVRV
eukprot:scaffold4963_cov93-Skeletonema_marinoi.AAC.1